MKISLSKRQIAYLLVILLLLLVADRVQHMGAGRAAVLEVDHPLVCD